MRRVAILVTGSREYAWDDRDFIESQILRLPIAMPGAEVLLIHGAQGVISEMGRPSSGLDLLAADVAEYTLGWKTLPMPAPWDDHGLAAGPMRNQWMVNVLVFLQRCGYECHVLAFPLPGSKGTHDCIRKARAAGFEVTVVPSTQETP